jgi:hypothetical protein
MQFSDAEGGDCGGGCGINSVTIRALRETER